TVNDTFNFVAPALVRDGRYWWTPNGAPISGFPGTWRISLVSGGVEIGSRTYEVSTGSGNSNIKVSQVATPIDDNRTTPIDFGTIAQGGPSASQTFVISNTGAAPLALSNLSLPPG